MMPFASKRCRVCVYTYVVLAPKRAANADSYLLICSWLLVRWPLVTTEVTIANAVAAAASKRPYSSPELPLFMVCNCSSILLILLV